MALVYDLIKTTTVDNLTDLNNFIDELADKELVYCISNKTLYIKDGTAIVSLAGGTTAASETTGATSVISPSNLQTYDIMRTTTVDTIKDLNNLLIDIADKELVYCLEDKVLYIKDGTVIVPITGAGGGGGTSHNEFATIAEMTASNFLLDDRVKLWGYHTLGDGGEHERICESTRKIGGIEVNGLWLNVVPVKNEVNIKWFGAVCDGTVDDGQAIEDAMDYCYTTDASTVVLPDAVIRCDRTLNPFAREYTLIGVLGATLDFTYMDASTYDAAIKFVANHPRGLTKFTRHYETGLEQDRGRIKRNALTQISLEGRNNGYRGWRCTDNSYKAGVTAIHIEHGYNAGNFERLAIVGFERGTKHGDHNYLLDFIDCGIAFCVYAIYCDLSAATDSGENMKFKGGAIGNCVNGIYNHLCGWWFSDMSIDYCERAVVYNQTKTGGVASGNMTFESVWFELSTRDGEFDGTIPYITNSSTMHFNNCILWTENVLNVYKSDHNEAIGVFNDCMFRIRGAIAEPLLDTADGGVIRVKGQIWDVNIDTMPIHYSLSNFPEGLPIRGAVDEWTVTNGTLTKEDRGSTDKPNKLVLTNTVEFNAATMLSAPFTLKSEAYRLMLGYNGEGMISNSHINRVRYYNSQGVQVGEQGISLFAGSSWKKTTTGIQQIPAGAETARLYLGLGNNIAGQKLELDFFYTEFL